MWKLLVPVLMLSTPCRGVNTSCQIPAVEEGQDTTLTCSFSDDVSKLQRDFKVHFYRHNTTAMQGNVLDCIWLYGKPECKVHDCCKYDNHVSNTLQIRVLNVTQDRVGRYVCFVLPAGPESYQFCNLTIKESIPVKESKSNLNALAALVVIVVVVIVIVVFGFLIWRHRRNSKKKGHLDTWSDCHINLCRKKSKEENKDDSRLIQDDEESKPPKPNSDISSKSEGHLVKSIYESEKCPLTQNREYEDERTHERVLYINNPNVIKSQRVNERNSTQHGVPSHRDIEFNATQHGVPAERDIEFNATQHGVPSHRDIEFNATQHGVPAEGDKEGDATPRGSPAERDKEGDATPQGSPAERDKERDATQHGVPAEIPSFEKRGPPLVPTEEGTITHALMQPIEIRRPNTSGKKKIRLLSRSKKSSEEKIDPNAIMTKRYNEVQSPPPTLFTPSSPDVEDDTYNKEQSNRSSRNKDDTNEEVPAEEKQKSSEAYKETETKSEKKERKKSERKELTEKKKKEKAEQIKIDERKKMQTKEKKEKHKAEKLGKIEINKEAEEESIEENVQEEQSKRFECKVGVSDRNIDETEDKEMQGPITTPSETPQAVLKENTLSE